MEIKCVVCGKTVYRSPSNIKDVDNYKCNDCFTKTGRNGGRKKGKNKTQEKLKYFARIRAERMKRNEISNINKTDTC